MTTTTEIAPDVYRISTYVPMADLQFNQFLVKDDEPFLYHTGMRGIFPVVHEAVRRIINPSDIRWIGFSHFEVDECGALNEWLALAPAAQTVCSQVGAAVNLNDFANRPPRGLAADEVFSTGKYRFRFRATPHLPHGWDAGVIFEETQGTFFCSDLFHQNGMVEALTESDIVERSRQALIGYQASFLMDYMPFTPKTEHGSTFIGGGAQALHDLGGGLTCALETLEVQFDQMPALKSIPEDQRSNFEIAEDGSFIHWPEPDIHLDVDAIRTAISPDLQEEARGRRRVHDRRYGAAIAAFRKDAGLRQSDISGLSERQVRRIEGGAPATTASLRLFAKAHGLSLSAYLDEIATLTSKMPTDEPEPVAPA